MSNRRYAVNIKDSLRMMTESETSMTMTTRISVMAMSAW